jgi:hypothetical protein
MTEAARLYAVGAGKVEITPPLDVPYLSFAPRHSPFVAVHDPLFVRSAVISDGKKTAAVTSAEAIGFINSVLGEGRNFTDEVRTRIHQKTGVRKEAVLLAAAHVHSSPDTLDIRPLRESPGAADWLEGLIEKVALSAEIAKKNMFQAHLKVAQGEFAGYSRNRRGDDCLDNAVTVLLFESPGSGRKVALVNYACHPVIVQAQDRISGDYVGVMTSVLERRIPGLEACLFLQGACGDINPWVNDTRDFADVDKMGTALGEKVKDILNHISEADVSAQPVLLNCASEFLALPSRRLPAPEKAKALQTSDNRMWLGQELEIRRLEGEGPFPAEIQALRLGNALLAAISGEPFCRMGKAVREIAAPLIGIPVGYANGYVGYIVPPEAWNKGGYEVEPGPWSKVGPESFPMIMAAFERLITTLRL